MSAELLDQYRRLMDELLIYRESEGGELPVDLESAYVERLDALWWKLSTTEQDAYEAELANPRSPAGPPQLDLIDRAVQQGSTAAPREAA